MPDQPSGPNPLPASPPASAPKPAASPQPAPPPRPGHMPMSEEFDRAKWTLPPAAPVLIVLGVLAVIVGTIAWIYRPLPQQSGEVVSVFAMQPPNQQSVLVAVQLNLHNLGKKPMRIMSAEAELTVPGQEKIKDEPASAVDFERYFQAFPELKQHSGNPLLIETDIAPGATQPGTLIFGFDVPKDAFDKRQKFTIRLWMHDREPMDFSLPQ
jgi:hypothetical protein